MDDKTRKRFTLLAAAGMLVARGVPALPFQASITDRVDHALQGVRDELRLSIDDIDALAAFDTDDATVGLY